MSEKESVLKALKSLAIELERVPHIKDWKGEPSAKIITTRLFNGWLDALQNAGLIEPILSDDDNRTLAISHFGDFLRENDSAPTSGDWDRLEMKPSRTVLTRLFGHWDEFYKVASKSCGLTCAKNPLAPFGGKKESKLEKDRPVSEKEDVVSLIELSRLELNGTPIICRASDGKINLTSISQALGKRLDNYFRSPSTQAFLSALDKFPHKEGVKLVSSEEGRNGGTWSDRRVAYNFVQWASGEFAAQVVVWLDNLFLTGSVALGKEKSTSELDALWKKKCAQLQLALDEKNNEISALLKEKETLFNPDIPDSIPEFSNGPTIYLLQDPRDIFKELTYGKTNNMNRRAKEYYESFKCVNPIIHKTWQFDTTQEMEDVEALLHRLFRKCRNPAKSEWLVQTKSTKAIRIIQYAVDGYKLQDNDD